MRHKTTLIHPENLINRGIKLRKVVHKEKEFVISRAAAYHAGFNSGFNIAEAINFALQGWLAVAEKAVPCKCVKDSVSINIELFKRVIDGDLDGPCPLQPASRHGQLPPAKDSSKSSVKKQPPKEE